MQVIQDTLAVGMPYESSREVASAPVRRSQRDDFTNAVARAITPFISERAGQLSVEFVRPASHEWDQPFEVLHLRTDNTPSHPWSRESDSVLEQVLNLADRTGATQIVIPSDKGLSIGLYNQYRYWTPSRARLLSAEIIRKHLDTLTD